MGVKDIAFPNLGIYLENVPKTFQIFGINIALYGVMIAVGILAGIKLAAWIAQKYNFNPEIIWDFSIYGVIFGVIGARIYYVVFSWDMYKDDLLSIFNTRNGGMAIYGSVIAAFLTLLIFCKKRKIGYFTMADICVPGLALGQVIGRWGNFFNREAFGDYSDGLLAMRLPIEAVRQGEITEKMISHIEEGMNYIQVHPTFLYEGLWNTLLILFLLYLWKHKKYEGQIALGYLGGYGLGRAVVEGLRTDQLHIRGTEIAVSQVLAIVLFISAILCHLIVLNVKAKVKHEN